MEKKEADNSFGVAGVIFGIFSIVSLSIVGIVLGVIGLIFSMKQKKIMANKWSKAGIILNVIGIVLGIVMLIFLVSFASEYISQLQSLGGYSA